MRGFMKILLAGFILMILGAGACGVVVFAGASSASHAITQAQKSDSAAARAFAPKFAKVTVGDSLTGKGGMTIARARALLGSPKPGNIVKSQSSGYVLTSWSYDFMLSNGKSVYSVDFANGRVSSKSSL